MPTCNGKKSAVAFDPNYWEKCMLNRKYEDVYVWNKEQYYAGEFFRDSTHGEGTYKWRNLATYEGGFYSNNKEGYAAVSFTDNSYFEGLFIRNQPFGPGIFTYSNGRQDAGFWKGSKLVRLGRSVDYIIPRLAPTSAAKIKLLQFRRLIPLSDTKTSTSEILEKFKLDPKYIPNPYSHLIYDTRSIFFDNPAFEKAYFINTAQLSKILFGDDARFKRNKKDEKENEDNLQILSWKTSPCPSIHVAFEENDEKNDICAKEIFSENHEIGFLRQLTKVEEFGSESRLDNSLASFEGEVEELEGEEEEKHIEEESTPSKIVSWNRSELCTEMLKQIFRYRAFEEKLNFDLAKLMLGARTAFRKTGEKEKTCLYFLKMCSIGPAHIIKELLCENDISAELMDSRGNNSLMFAAAMDQHEIIEILLDYGVDVNNYNDEGLTPLNLCLLRRLAQTNNLYSWETSFLPQEVDQSLSELLYKLLDGEIDDEEYEIPESIQSLDRVFGDGMSVCDSVIGDQSLVSLVPYAEKKTKEVPQNLFNVSDITIINSKFEHSKVSPGLELTPKGTSRIVPKSNKADEYERSTTKSPTDRYLFELSFEKKDSSELNVSRKKEHGKKSLEAEVEHSDEEEEANVALIQKVREIDKTIETLLRRGADPNSSDVPRPSIHLGIYTKEENIVRMLLTYGANPDSRLYPNEGLLTPLHVLVLLKPNLNYVKICHILLNFGANPEEETLPEFAICEEEKPFLDPNIGRTPLQLLCMRPDLEYIDQLEYLISIGLMLVRASDLQHFYKGHSCLTLAMHFGNLKLLKALLDSGFINPNEILGKELGTALHVLVSTDLQRKTLFEKSKQICDLLLDGGADETIEFDTPGKLQGTCIDYGYREVNAEKEARKNAGLGKSTSRSFEKIKRGKSKERDYLDDHISTIEYLVNRKKQKVEKQVSVQEKLPSAVRSKLSHKIRQKSYSREIYSQDQKAEKKSRSEHSRSRLNVQWSETTSPSGVALKKSILKTAGSQSDNKITGYLTSGKWSENELARGTRSEEDAKNKEKKMAKETGEDVSKKDKESKKLYERGKGEGKSKGEKDSKKGKSTKDNEKEGKGKSIKENEKEGKGKGTKDSEKEGKAKGKSAQQTGYAKDSEKSGRRPDINLWKVKTRSSFKLPSTRTGTEMLPETFRRTMIQVFGNCHNIDINELLLPYVVLRDGELYYRFKGNVTGKKEQYSLI